MDRERLRTRLDRYQLDSIGTLDDPTRRRLYEYVVSSGAAVTRDHASTALGLERSLVAYHLDKLVAEGLLDASFARPPGRGGPGAGRPAKHYERADREFSVSLPPRDYRLLAEVLASALERDRSGAVRRALEAAAEQRGQALGREQAEEGHGATGIEGLLRRLADLGYEPYEDEGVIRLRNCPFHRLAREHTELVCGMNLTMLAGLSEGFDAAIQPRLDPRPDRCCVAFHRN
jgi:predicted ArsR family transcriptional regulator